jgi:hypothetical protein
MMNSCREVVTMGKVPYGAELSHAQRMAVASASGHAERMIFGLGRPVDEHAVAELHAITTDPAVYGMLLGNVLGRMDKPGWEHLQPIADLYRQAGADLEVAERQRQWQATQPWAV